MTEYDLGFPLACSMMVCGPSCAGKSHFVMQLLLRRQLYFTPQAKHVLWYHGEVTLTSRLPEVEYHRCLPQPEDVEAMYQCIVLLDDLMWESHSSQLVGNLFTRVAHQRQCFIIHITQNLFQRGSITRTQSLNAHYLALFKNPRDRQQVVHLARQIRGSVYNMSDINPFQKITLV
jgi:hypothetical protein